MRAATACSRQLTPQLTPKLLRGISATSNPAFNLVTFEPLRTLVSYQGTVAFS